MIKQDRLFKIKAKVFGHIICINQEYSYSFLPEIWETYEYCRILVIIWTGDQVREMRETNKHFHAGRIQLF